MIPLGARGGVLSSLDSPPQRWPRTWAGMGVVLVRFTSSALSRTLLGLPTECRSTTIFQHSRKRTLGVKLWGLSVLIGWPCAPIRPVAFRANVKTPLFLPQLIGHVSPRRVRGGSQCRRASICDAEGQQSM